ncbi:Predicted N-acetyltransferase YhbS [Acetitomaculum ruminis DSM 5522]|uniref:Predicted N-acetyltransferase YhbS n=1 Tax=Acetitomaculum ruminis DSM 5522 TaxID=1120918 RepID=A0A1I1AGZ8_9FIRM|nr:N-acetyltransferase [Acetitomaculum ruminis]SFB36762.1 Predicted N-acetyltransferase YhbS [Acetitomaculum ruminis DSM 5522]
MSIIFRREEEKDYRTVENLIRESFWDVYRPGCLEHYVMHRFRNNPVFVKELDILMEKDGELIGQNIFVKAIIKADDGRDIPILAMGPICIAPKYKRQGYGKKLLDYCLDQAAALGYGAVFFEGNIDFYGKSGFVTAKNFSIRYHDLPEGEDSSFFLGKELISGYLKGITGEYTPPKGYMVALTEGEEFEKFDALFPEKEKHILEGQLFDA